MITLPHVIVEVGEPLKSLSEEEALTLQEVRVQQRLSLPTLCELTFENLPTSATVNPILSVGNNFQVSVKKFSTPLFIGKITAVEHSYEPSSRRVIRVRGYDWLHQLRKRQPVQVRVQSTILNLARELVEKLKQNITIKASGNSGTLPEQIIQYAQSDLGLLQEMAGEQGLYFTLRGKVLHLLTLKGIGKQEQLVLGESLHEARVDINSDTACRSVKVDGWNPLLTKKYEGQVKLARVGRDIPSDAPPDKVGGTGECFLVDEVIRDNKQAEGIAQAKLDFYTAREVSFWGVADGAPDLRPGTPIKVKGLHRSVEGSYVLTSVNHTIDGQKGFLSEISTMPPPPPQKPRGCAVTFGEVTQINDPKKLGRVKVKLPTYNNLETEWMGVVCPGAGANKGIISLPDIDDQVVVLFARENPIQGMILGGLYGSKSPPDTGIESGSVKKFTFLTPGQQKMVLDDGRKSVLIQNADGSYLELLPGTVKLHSKRKLVIEAPKNPIVIRGSSIDFDKG